MSFVEYWKVVCVGDGWRVWGVVFFFDVYILGVVKIGLWDCFEGI